MFHFAERQNEGGNGFKWTALKLLKTEGLTGSGRVSSSTEAEVKKYLDRPLAVGDNITGEYCGNRSRETTERRETG